VLAYIGMKLGAQWDSDLKFKAVFHRFQLGVEVVILVGFVWFVWTHWKNRAKVEAI
jgi:membrane protein DedA with SNARE-associated domain